MNASLRPAIATDAPRVASLLIDTRARCMPYAASAHTEIEVRQWVSRTLLPSGGVIVAEAEGSIVAAMHTKRTNSISWITQIVVDPAHVGKGIGSLLLAHAKRELPRPIRLYTFQANVGARRFYERHGFTAVEFTDGQGNEERCPDVLYQLDEPKTEA